MKDYLITFRVVGDRDNTKFKEIISEFEGSEAWGKLVQLYAPEHSLMLIDVEVVGQRCSITKLKDQVLEILAQPISKQKCIELIREL